MEPSLLSQTVLSTKNGETEQKALKKRNVCSMAINSMKIVRQKRKTKQRLRAEEKLNLQNAIRVGLENRIKVRWISNKGRGIFAMENFSRGDFVVEYAGELIDMKVARYREHLYASTDPSGTSYMFYFRFDDKSLW